MASVVVYIDQSALELAATTGHGVKDAVEAETRAICGRANSLSSGFRTQRTKNYATGEHVGGTQPEYGYKVSERVSRKTGKDTPIGIVATDNYAARKDNLLNNTLAKARG